MFTFNFTESTEDFVLLSMSNSSGSPLKACVLSSTCKNGQCYNLNISFVSENNTYYFHYSSSMAEVEYMMLRFYGEISEAVNFCFDNETHKLVDYNVTHVRYESYYYNIRVASIIPLIILFSFL